MNLGVATHLLWQTTVLLIITYSAFANPGEEFLNNIIAQLKNQKVPDNYQLFHDELFRATSRSSEEYQIHETPVSTFYQHKSSNIYNFFLIVDGSLLLDHIRIRPPRPRWRVYQNRYWTRYGMLIRRSPMSKVMNECANVPEKTVISPYLNIRTPHKNY